ncbi:hypothetical protein V8E54_002265 [Elaphomyces granulatus]
MDSSDSESLVEKQYLEDLFGPLLSISADSLAALASSVRSRVSGKDSSGCHVVTRLYGAHSLVYVVEFDDGIKYAIRISASAWDGRFTEAAKCSLISQVHTMRFIREKTTIPLPEVYAFDTTSENEIGVPYIVMSFIDGSTVLSMWFDKTGPTPLEERRLRTLDTVAQAMSQLQKFQFDKIGSLQFNSGTDSIEIGPCYKWDDGQIGDENYGKIAIIEQFGPFNTSQSYLEYFVKHNERTGKPDPYRLGIGSQKLLSMMIPCLPCPRKSFLAREKFVLSLPDFNPQNILIDERGNLTGIIGWGNVQTVPRFLGYSSFPSWITRDWGPVMYNPKSDKENSPEELDKYRRWYNRRMEELLNGNGDSVFTIKSHIFEAIAIAAMDDVCRLCIVMKIVEQVIPERDDYGAFGLIQDAGDGKLMPSDIRRLKKRFKALFSTGWKRRIPFTGQFFLILKLLLTLPTRINQTPCLPGWRSYLPAV